ncbi:MAG: hypothetical protein R3B72_47245 [Polyangiaceae bacterium]
MEIESVSLTEVIAAARSRHASLVPESCGYILLGIARCLGGRPMHVVPALVRLDTEGAIAFEGPRERRPASVTSQRLGELLHRLLDVAQVSATANALRSVVPEGEAPPPLEKLFTGVTRALIPINRSAARRALARLARETLRAKRRGLVTSEDLEEVSAGFVDVSHEEVAPEPTAALPAAPSEEDAPSASPAPVAAPPSVQSSPAPAVPAAPTTPAPSAATPRTATTPTPSCQVDVAADAAWEDIEADFDLLTPTPAPSVEPIASAEAKLELDLESSAAAEMAAVMAVPTDEGDLGQEKANDTPENEAERAEVSETVARDEALDGPHDESAELSVEPTPTVIDDLEPVAAEPPPEATKSRPDVDAKEEAPPPADAVPEADAEPEPLDEAKLAAELAADVRVVTNRDEPRRPTFVKRPEEAGSVEALLAGLDAADAAEDPLAAAEAGLLSLVAVDVTPGPPPGAASTTRWLTLDAEPKLPPPTLGDEELSQLATFTELAERASQLPAAPDAQEGTTDDDAQEVAAIDDELADHVLAEDGDEDLVDDEDAVEGAVDEVEPVADTAGPMTDLADDDEVDVEASPSAILAAVEPEESGRPTRATETGISVDLGVDVDTASALSELEVSVSLPSHASMLSVDAEPTAAEALASEAETNDETGGESLPIALTVPLSDEPLAAEPPAGDDDEPQVEEDLLVETKSPGFVELADDESIPPTAASMAPPRRRRRFRLLAAAAILLGAGGLVAATQMGRNPISALRRAMAPAPAAATTPGRCLAEIRLRELPASHEVLLSLGPSGGELAEVPTGVPLELVVTAPGHDAQRVLVPADASWIELEAGHRRLSLPAVELKPGLGQSWPGAPEGRVGGLGPAGQLELASAPSGEVWLVVAAGEQDHAAFSVACDREAKLLVVDTQKPDRQRRLEVAEPLLRAAAANGGAELSGRP